MSAASSESGEQGKDLEKLVDQAIRSSQRWQRRFWLLNGLWLVAALAAAVIFGYSVFRFDQAQREINELRKTENEQVQRVENLETQLRGQVQRVEDVESKLKK